MATIFDAIMDGMSVWPTVAEATIHDRVMTVMMITMMNRVRASCCDGI